MTDTTVPFRYSPIVDRPPLSWPGGARVAVHIGLNIEHFVPGLPSTSIWPGTADLVPDALNHGWRDYGARVGIWRTIDVLDRHGVRPSALLNSLVVERTVLREIVETIEAGTGTRPRGWMGPGLTETARTPELLAELGFDHVLDWTNDDQPYPLTVPGMLSVPYTLELNDLLLFARGVTGPEFVRMVCDQYEQLRADAAGGSGRVLALALHPFVIGQAFRTRYLDEVLGWLTAQPDAWITTTDDIADHYRAVTEPGRVAGPGER
ncbi:MULTISPECIES: polysaccharide deacetylase [Pseudonocardia]|uniref:Polysaccharide deacetylase n=2 Tax=Pseudonocardia TaxID=1847 RepID=A0A1Y2N1V0_PSEAH|nr:MULTISPECIES: polysaccharide deacetylase [Pseudonocardia]OSY41444.1 hypothetical protein BG845_01935 [Pseudonocardia autotrophica]TDN71401.1 hypothetical protein C8E95_0431 [Pseudonocardia autotrophica]BBG02077.1 polysaccharide deacetylase [Pseudonocardia autotrophica]GEC24091.1 polysaccharide deacetylase [Pseudonocardia saturnea]